MGFEILGPVNVGAPGDFRVPDLCLVRGLPRETFVPSVPMVVEIRSASDETFAKFDFYARHEVEEILVVSPEPRAVQWFRLEKGAYVEAREGALLVPGSAALATELQVPE
jgi:Uma2 family endonuclease